MKFLNHSMNTAYQLGAYKALAELMSEAVQNLAAAENEFDRTWATKRLVGLAEQFAETQAKFEKQSAAA